MLKRIKNLFKKKELTLDHVHTFRDGTRLYTYRAEDWGNIASRYYTAIQSHLANVEIFGQTKAEWERSIHEVQARSLEALEVGEFKNYVKFTTNMNQLANYWQNKIIGIKTINDSLISSMFCCFYLIDGETKYGYSEENNKKKLALLEKEPEMREIFFLKVKKSLEDLLGTYEQDIPTYLVKMREQVDNMKIFTNTPKT